MYYTNDTANTVVSGTSGDDILYNYASYVTMIGGDGDDDMTSFSTLTSDIYEGYVTLLGGNGKDTIDAFGDLALVEGGNGDDSLYSSGDNNTIIAGEGNDVIQNYGAFSRIYGNAGNDSVDNKSIGDHSTISGGAGNDTISLSTASDNNVIEYSYGDGNDVIIGFNSDDTIKIGGGSYIKSDNNGDLILSVGTGSITFKDKAGESINIIGSVAGAAQDTVETATNTDAIDLSQKTSDSANNITYIVNNYYYGDVNNNTINGNNNIIGNNNVVTYTYSGGNKVINNYNEGDVIRLDSDYQGIGLNGNSFFVNSSSGSLEIQDSRDKFIGYSAGNDDVAVYSYVASGGGNVDGRGKSQAEVMIGGDYSDNQMYAGSGGSSLWGGNGGNDVLVGGNGYDEFFYAVGSGSDVIQNANSNDLINLLGVSLSQITGYSWDNYSVSLQFNDGGNLRVEGNSGTGYILENQVFVCNQSTGEWSIK